MQNLLAPLVFDWLAAQAFARDNVCALCRGYLVLHQVAGGYEAVCPTHGAMMAHNHMSKRLAGRDEYDERQALKELEPAKPKRTSAEILKELGF